MQNELMFFLFSAVLLVLVVPLVSGQPLIPDVCALPPDQGFKSSDSCTVNKDKSHTCCWTEPGTGTGLIKLREKYCQTCRASPSGPTCDPKELQVIGKPPAPEADSGVLQDPSTDSGPKLLQKDGMIFKLPTENNTASPEVNSTR